MEVHDSILQRDRYEGEGYKKEKANRTYDQHMEKATMRRDANAEQELCLKYQNESL